MFEFAYPWALLLYLPLALLFLYAAFYQRRASIVVSSSAPFAKTRRRRPDWGQSCMFLAAAILVGALARPRFGDEKVLIKARGIDMIMALDLSGSMEAIDVPENVRSGEALLHELKTGAVKPRVEAAKEELKRFIEKRPNDRIGLVGFAQLAYTFAPPTLDHSWLYAHLEQLKTGVVGDMTGIASPIAVGTERLKNSDAPRRVLVLFTDGRNNIDNRLTPLQAAKLAKEFNVIVHTVGIGSGNACIAYPPGSHSFQPVQGEFDEELLKSIAEATGGKYFHAADTEGMRQVMQSINALEKTSVEQPKYMEYRELAPKLAVTALLLLLAGYAAGCTWKLRLP